MTDTTPRYLVEHDANGISDGHVWHVLDTERDGDVMDSFKTKAEAEADARERHEEDEAVELRELISETLGELDLKALNKLAACLKQIM